MAAIQPDEVEAFRPLLPVGYATGASAYQVAAANLTAANLTTHYTSGLEFFHQEFVPKLKQKLSDLTGGVWNLDDYIAFGAGSDVDLMTHLVEAIATRGRVALYPGDWYGFRMGCTQTDSIHWDTTGTGDLACLCVPSVRNGHVTAEMVSFLGSAKACLLNLNLFPTLNDNDRESVASDLVSVLPKSVLSVSFSRGFGLTTSQLGVALVHRDHPFSHRFAQQWNWLTYFYNALAAKAFLEFDLAAAQAVDRKRAEWVKTWLEERELPVVESGSYYVKSFRVDGTLPETLAPLRRENVVRLCFKPVHT